MCPFVCAGVAQGQSNCLVSSGSGVQILPPAPAFSRGCQVRPADSGRYPSGQRGQTVNLLAYAFGGSNPPLPTTVPAAMRPDQTEGGLRKARLLEARAATRCAVSQRLGAYAATRCVVSRLREAPAVPGLALREVFVALQSGGNSSAVERQPSKLGVAGSNPVSRSRSRVCAHVAQSAERVLGKDEVSGSIPDMGSRTDRRATARRTWICEPQDVAGLGPRRPRRAQGWICEPQDVAGLGPRRPRRASDGVIATAHGRV